MNSRVSRKLYSTVKLRLRDRQGVRGQEKKNTLQTAGGQAGVRRQKTEAQSAKLKAESSKTEIRLKIGN